MGMISKKAGCASALGFALGAAMMMAQPVAAAVDFKFGVLAWGNEGDWDDRAGNLGSGAPGGAWVGTKYVVGGIGVTASAENTAGSLPPSRAYLDNDGSTAMAGLGVCSLYNATSGAKVSCAGSSDDNTGLAGDTGSILETLVLTFDQEVKIENSLFTDRGHSAHTDDFYVGLEIDGNSSVFQANNSGGGAIGTGTVFKFLRLVATGASGAPDGSNSTRDFYMNALSVSQVPLPAGVLLLGSALGGLGLMGRRRKAA